MVVLDRQQVLCLPVEPTSAGQGLALGTVAVATRIVGNAFTATVEALLDVSAQRRRAARRQIAQRFPLRDRHQRAILGRELFAMLAKYIRHFHRRPRTTDGGDHAEPSAALASPGTRTCTGRDTANPSSNAGNACNRRMLTCRYFAVVLKWLWPNSAWTESRSTPASSKWVAKLCRHGWGCTRFVSPARRAVRWQIRCTVPSVNASVGLMPGNSHVAGRYSRQ